MLENLNNKQLHDLVARLNARDTGRIKNLLDRFFLDTGILVKAIGEYRVRLGLGGVPSEHSEDLGLHNINFFQNGAEAFMQVLREHPIFYEERTLAAGTPIFEDPDEPLLSEFGFEVSELLLAGALAIGFIGALDKLDKRYLQALTHVAFSADAISTLLRTILIGDRIPQIDHIFHIPDRLQDLHRNACVLGVEHALNEFGIAAASNLSTSWSTGITSLQPNAACPGDQVTINGINFGRVQPNDVEVWFPSRQRRCMKADIVTQWSDDKIVVLAPANVGTGCVGFVKLPPNPIPLNESANNLAGEMELCFGQTASAAAEKLRNIGRKGILVMCPPCLPNGVNYFQGGLPVIDAFSINGGFDLTVQPNTVLNLTWRVRNATIVRIRRTSAGGPYIDVTNPINQTINVGTFTGNSLVEAIYELTATNGCGTITGKVKVLLRTEPVLSITGIEVVQTIQRPNNSVRLVAGKRTMVRIFVDSGITNGFNNGAGPNLQPNVTGDLSIFPAGANQGFDAGLPMNPGGIVAALDSSMPVNRNNLTQSLNFELPLSQLLGPVRIDARVWVKGHENDIAGPWRAVSSITVIFQSQPAQEVLPILIADLLLGLPAPTLVQYNTSLQGARTRYPIAEDGFIVNPSQMLILGGNRNLTTVLGWQLLLTDITTMIFVSPNTPVGGIRTALVPNDPRYAVNGMGIARIALSIPAFIARAATAGANGLDPFAGTFAHEMGHSFGIGHSPACFTPTLLDPVDGRLPGGTEDTGIEVATNTLIPNGRGEIMSYNGDRSACPGLPRWPSIVFWDIIFNSLPI